MAINFPAGPTQGQQYTDPTCGVTWIWDGLCWLDAGTGGGDFVPQDSPTGAASMPTGTLAQRPAAPVVGMQRFNSASGYEEVYVGADGWRRLAYASDIESLPDLVISATNTSLPCGGYYENIIVEKGITAYALATTRLRARTSVKIDGTIIVTQSLPGATGQGVSSTTVGAVGAAIGQGLGAQGLIYGYSALLGSGGVAATFIVENGSGSGSAGGSGGGSLALFSEGTLTMGAGAVIYADGMDGVAGAATVGTAGVQIPGGGGGSGGFIYLEAAVSLTLDPSVGLVARGGAGYPGFAGGSREVYGAGGGSGGGGGYIVLCAPSITSVTGNFNVSGGAPGIASSYPAQGPSFLGGGGGAWGGTSGSVNGGAYPWYAQWGDPGQVLYNAFLN